MFDNLSIPHVLMVIAIALLLFGPKRIPEIAGSMGKGIREFKKSMSEIGAPDDGAFRPDSVAPPVSRERTEVFSSIDDRGAPKRLLDPAQGDDPTRP